MVFYYSDYFPAKEREKREKKELTVEFLSGRLEFVFLLEKEKHGFPCEEYSFKSCDLIFNSCS